MNWVKIELYNSIFITYNPKHVEPTKKMLFGRFFESCFHHSKLKKLSLGDENWEQVLVIFRLWKLSGIFIIIINQWDPSLCIVHTYLYFPLPSPMTLSYSLVAFSFFLSFSSFAFLTKNHPKKKKKKSPQRQTHNHTHNKTQTHKHLKQFFIKLINTNPQSHPQQTQIHHHTMATQTRKCKKEERDRFERWSMWRLERWRSTNPMGFFYK